MFKYNWTNFLLTAAVQTMSQPPGSLYHKLTVRTKLINEKQKQTGLIEKNYQTQLTRGSHKPSPSEM